MVKDKIKYAIAHHFGVQPTKIYLTYPTFFSEISTKKAVTIHDEYWHPHVDKVSKTKFLLLNYLFSKIINTKIFFIFLFIQKNYNKAFLCIKKKEIVHFFSILLMYWNIFVNVYMYYFFMLMWCKNLCFRSPTSHSITQRCSIWAITI